ncbi:unnamed protein product [Gongylonema pulchrum]|uniref:RAB3GAP2_C domain-containing protein n=1 Tax=Gongylonema pulchrum TaxID=637853 RepID=A0A183EJ92_9BILA|nr:unnamed protein product [Gongylonema pulchrum]
MVTKLPTFWNRIEASVIRIVVEQFSSCLALASIRGRSVATNVLALFAMLDSEADWFKSWLHSFPYRNMIKSKLSILSKKIFKYLRNAEKDKISKQPLHHSFLGYSGRQIHQLLLRSCCLITLNWLKYNDLSDLYSGQQWIQILELAVNSWNQKKGRSDISHVLYHLASCRNSAQFLLNSAGISVLKKLTPSTFVAILSTASLNADLARVDKLLVRKEILYGFTPDPSKRLQFRSFFDLEDCVWNQLLRLFSHPNKYSLEELQSQCDMLQNLKRKNSVEAFLKCAQHGLFVVSKQYLEVELTERQLVASHLMEQLNCESVTACVNCRDSRNQYKNYVFEMLVTVLWQPYSGVQTLRYFDCATYFRNLFQRIRTTGNFEAVRKIRILALNLDVVIELRCRSKLMWRIVQVLFW